MNIDKTKIVIDERELKNRLGGADISIASDALEDVINAMKPAYVIRETDVKLYDEGVDIGFGYIDSKNLRRNLRDCSKAYAVCITIGHDIDRLLRRYSLESASKLYLFDAAASAAVESVVDYVHGLIGKKTMARFAPGYGDFSIEYQKQFLDFVGGEKIGVGLSESSLMLPTKSVTCVIGVLDED